MRDDSHDDFARSFVGEVENPIIADANASTVAILELLAARRKRIVLEREKHAGDTLLHRAWEPG
jgi:hypothetical protein